MCHPRHPIYLFFLSLGVMPRFPTALHLSVAYDDITAQQIAMKTTNFLYIHIIYCRNLHGCEVIVTSQSEIVRKAHA